MKKGFTLIELLAVIVVLAILALVVTPIVLNIVENAQRGSDERSLEQYAKVMQTSYYELKMKDPTLTLEEYLSKVDTASGATLTYNGSKVVCSERKVVEIVSGTQSIELRNCTVDGRGVYNFINGVASKQTDDTTNEVKKDGDVVYFDVKTGEICNNYHEDNSKTGYNGTNPTGNQTSCLKFYAFNLNESSDRVKLLLDHNTTDSVLWSSTSDANGPSANSGYVLDKLKSDTSGWFGTIEPEDYITPKYTVDYSGYKARLITAQEIAEITGKTSWNGTSKIEFSGLITITTSGDGVYECPSSGCKYTWLYDRTSTSCKKVGCSNNAVGDTSMGYWTASYASNLTNAFNVFHSGKLESLYINNKRAVRPVIEILKSKIS